MNSNNINGYTIEIPPQHKLLDSRFITLIDEQSRRYQFNMIKSDGKWIIRNPGTVVPFIVEIEQEVAKFL